MQGRQSNGLDGGGPRLVRLRQHLSRAELAGVQPDGLAVHLEHRRGVAEAAGVGSLLSRCHSVHVELQDVRDRMLLDVRVHVPPCHLDRVVARLKAVSIRHIKGLVDRPSRIDLHEPQPQM